MLARIQFPSSPTSELVHGSGTKIECDPTAGALRNLKAWERKKSWMKEAWLVDVDRLQMFTDPDTVKPHVFPAKNWFFRPHGLNIREGFPMSQPKLIKKLSCSHRKSPRSTGSQGKTGRSVGFGHHIENSWASWRNGDVFCCSQLATAGENKSLLFRTGILEWWQKSDSCFEKTSFFMLRVQQSWRPDNLAT